MNKEQELARKAISYSTDVLIPGIYLWLDNWSLRIGGSETEDSYPGVIHSFAGTRDRFAWISHLEYLSRYL